MTRFTITGISNAFRCSFGSVEPSYYEGRFVNRDTLHPAVFVGPDQRGQIIFLSAENANTLFPVYVQVTLGTTLEDMTDSYIF